MILNILQKLRQTDDNKASIILRISFFIMIFAHGAGKVLGIFGGLGFEKTMHHMTENMYIPYIFALIAIVVEFVSSLLLILGYQTRINAFLLGIIMFVASTFHFKNGFYMNWFGQKAGEGFEFHILAIGMMLALIVLGGGKYSLDNTHKKKNLK